MKRLLLILMVISMLICFAGCGENVSLVEQKPSIVCTVFPVYDWINEILGEKTDDFDVRMLGKAGMDLHSYQPSAQDIATIAECELIVYVGGASDAWIEEAVKNSSGKNIREIKLFDILCDYIETETGEHHHDDHADEYDEHVWLSLNMAEKTVKAIADELAELDRVNEEIYAENARIYANELDLLDTEYKKAVDESKDRTIIVADRFPFLYLVRDYGISYYAAFPGCSADADVSFDTVLSLAENADRLQKETLLVTENPGEAIAESVIAGMKSENVRTADLNSCQTVVDVEKADYLDIMRENLASLKLALE